MIIFTCLEINVSDGKKNNVVVRLRLSGTLMSSVQAFTKVASGNALVEILDLSRDKNKEALKTIAPKMLLPGIVSKSQSAGYARIEVATSGYTQDAVVRGPALGFREKSQYTHSIAANATLLATGHGRTAVSEALQLRLVALQQKYLKTPHQEPGFLQELYSLESEQERPGMIHTGEGFWNYYHRNYQEGYRLSLSLQPADNSHMLAFQKGLQHVPEDTPHIEKKDLGERKWHAMIRDVLMNVSDTTERSRNIRLFDDFIRLQENCDHLDGRDHDAYMLGLSTVTIHLSCLPAAIRQHPFSNNTDRRIAQQIHNETESLARNMVSMDELMMYGNMQDFLLMKSQVYKQIHDIYNLMSNLFASHPEVNRKHEVTQIFNFDYRNRVPDINDGDYRVRERIPPSIEAILEKMDQPQSNGANNPEDVFDIAWNVPNTHASPFSGNKSPERFWEVLWNNRVEAGVMSKRELEKRRRSLIDTHGFPQLINGIRTLGGRERAGFAKYLLSGLNDPIPENSLGHILYCHEYVENNQAKGLYLKSKGFSPRQIRLLLEYGVCGKPDNKPTTQPVIEETTLKSTESHIQLTNGGTARVFVSSFEKNPVVESEVQKYTAGFVQGFLDTFGYSPRDLFISFSHKKANDPLGDADKETYRISIKVLDPMYHDSYAYTIDPNNHVISASNMMTDAAFRDKGIGTKFRKTILDACEKAGIRKQTAFCAMDAEHNGGITRGLLGFEFDRSHTLGAMQYSKFINIIKEKIRTKELPDYFATQNTKKEFGIMDLVQDSHGREFRKGQGQFAGKGFWDIVNKEAEDYLKKNPDKSTLSPDFVLQFPLYGGFHGVFDISIEDPQTKAWKASPQKEFFERYLDYKFQKTDQPATIAHTPIDAVQHLSKELHGKAGERESSMLTDDHSRYKDMVDTILAEDNDDLREQYALEILSQELLFPYTNKNPDAKKLLLQHSETIAGFAVFIHNTTRIKGETREKYNARKRDLLEMHLGNLRFDKKQRREISTVLMRLGICGYAVNVPRVLEKTLANDPEIVKTAIDKATQSTKYTYSMASLIEKLFSSTPLMSIHGVSEKDLKYMISYRIAQYLHRVSKTDTVKRETALVDIQQVLVPAEYEFIINKGLHQTLEKNKVTTGQDKQQVRANIFEEMYRPESVLAQSSNHLLVELSTREHFKKESQELSHCMGKDGSIDNYKDKLIKGRCRYFSLRNSQGKRMRTIEYDIKTATITEMSTENDYYLGEGNQDIASVKNTIQGLKALHLALLDNGKGKGIRAVRKCDAAVVRFLNTGTSEVLTWDGEFVDTKSVNADLVFPATVVLNKNSRALMSITGGDPKKHVSNCLDTPNIFVDITYLDKVDVYQKVFNLSSTEAHLVHNGVFSVIFANLSHSGGDIIAPYTDRLDLSQLQTLGGKIKVDKDCIIIPSTWEQQGKVERLP